MIRLGNNEVLKTLTKILTFVDADAKANPAAKGSTKALCESCLGELIKISEVLEKLDHEVSICSLIPPAMAISDNTQIARPTKGNNSK